MFIANFKPIKVGEKHIVKHDIFKSASLYKLSIADIKFNESIKTELFRLILTIVNKIIVTETLAFVKDHKSYRADELLEKMTGLLTNISSKYEKEIKEEITLRFREDADKIYEIVYTRGFAVYHNKNIIYIANMVKSFDKSNLRCRQKIYMFLNLLNVALFTAIMDCEEFFAELNGDLKEFNKKWRK